MINVYIPHDREFSEYEDEVRQMYMDSQEKICDTNSYEFIRNNTMFYLFEKNKLIIGVMYFFRDDGKLYMNAFGNRKHFAEKIECIKMSQKWFKCDIYAEAQNRASALCLLRSGFKRVQGKLFVFKNCVTQNNEVHAFKN